MEELPALAPLTIHRRLALELVQDLQHVRASDAAPFRCTEHLEQATMWLELAHMDCVDYNIHGEFKGSDHDEHINALCSENNVLAELWHTISAERYEDLAIRDRAYRAQHGR